MVVVILESSLNMDQGPDMDLDEPPSCSSATASSHNRKMKGQGQFVEPLGDEATMPIAQGADKARDSSSLVSNM